MSSSNIYSLPPATGNYEVDRQRHLLALQKRLPGEEEKMTWSLERLHRLRDERLQALVRVAKERSPWHARRLRHIDPDKLCGEDLSSIPPMTKDDVMTHWDEIVTDHSLTLDLARRHLGRVDREGPAYLLDRYHVVSSGGTSGQRGIFVWDFEGWLQAFLVRKRAIDWIVRYFALEDLQRTAFITAASPLHISAGLRETFCNSSNAWRSFPATLPMAEIVNGLNEYQPERIITYARTLSQLAREAHAGRLHIVPRAFMSGGEPLTSEIRQAVEETFGAFITDCYASTENAVMALSYPGSSVLHLVEDTSVYEPIDAKGLPVTAGTPAAKLLTTNVINQVMPLIRYELGDEVLLLDTPESHPWTGRQIAPVQGRVEEIFSYPGGIEIHPLVFISVLEGQSAINEFQVYQTEQGADILLQLNSSDHIDLEIVKQQLVAVLRREGITMPEIAFRVVDHVEHQAATGKIKRFHPQS